MAQENAETLLHCDLWIDLGSLDSYMALNALRKAIVATDAPVQVNLRPFFQAKAKPSADEAERMAEAAKRRGIKLDEATMKEDHQHDWRRDLAAHKMIAYAREVDQTRGSAVGSDTLELRIGEALLRSRFEVGVNLENPEVLIGVGQDLGVAGDESFGALGDLGLEDDVLEQFQLGSHLGITDVPLLIVADTYQVPGSLDSSAYQKVLATALRENIKP